jgi:hypothetical protein
MEGPDADVRVRTDTRGGKGVLYTWSECRRCIREKRAEARRETGAVVSNRARPNLTDADREWILTYLSAGFSPAAVAEQCDVGLSTVYKIRATMDVS